MGDVSRFRLLVQLVLIHSQQLREYRRVYEPLLPHQLLDHRHGKFPLRGITDERAGSKLLTTVCGAEEFTLRQAPTGGG